MYAKKNQFTDETFWNQTKKNKVKVCSEYNFQSEFMEKEFAIILEARGD